MKDKINVVEIKDSYGKANQVTHNPIVPNNRARMAISLMERWGMVAARVDENEDSAGRSKLRNMPADEVVEYACSIADAAFNAFESNGWLTIAKLPEQDDDTT